jgi:medium-chain acyl-[acyl-carrier-protein] hydrolase
MIPIWKESFKITSYQVDFREQIKPTSLMQLFQEAAGNHAQHLGAGYAALAEEKLFWALSRIKVEIQKTAKWGDEIHIETWPCSLVGPFFRRDFMFFNHHDEVICRGVSGWLLLNAETMRPQRANKLAIELPFNEGKFALTTFPDRLNGKAETPIFSKTILYNEIDVNNHVNNTRYLDWVMDCFGREYYRSHTLKSFTLEFLGEMYWGNEVELISEQEDLLFHIQAVNKETGKIAFRADVNWSDAV